MAQAVTGFIHQDDSVPTEHIDEPIDFTQPFIGYLPGFLSHSEQAAPERVDTEIYLSLVAQRWMDLLGSPASKDESLLQSFLERHPCLLPGSHSVDGGLRPQPSSLRPHQQTQTSWFERSRA